MTDHEATPSWIKALSEQVENSFKYTWLDSRREMEVYRMGVIDAYDIVKKHLDDEESHSSVRSSENGATRVSDGGEQTRTSHSQPSGKTIVPVPVSGGSVGGNRVGRAGELSDGEMKQPKGVAPFTDDVEHAPRKGYKYASCTAPIGERCGKHGTVHRENKDDEVGRT